MGRMCFDARRTSVAQQSSPIITHSLQLITCPLYLEHGCMAVRTIRVSNSRTYKRHMFASISRCSFLHPRHRNVFQETKQLEKRQEFRGLSEQISWTCHRSHSHGGTGQKEQRNNSGATFDPARTEKFTTQENKAQESKHQAYSHLTSQNPSQIHLKSMKCMYL